MSAIVPRPEEAPPALAAEAVPGLAEQVVLVHDYLLVRRGAERTFEAIAACFPRAPIATLLHDDAATDGRFADRDVTTSFLQPYAARQDGFRRFLPLLPLAAARLALADRPIVVSSSSAFAHGVRPSPHAVHVCYCHSPFRYAWHERDRAAAQMPRGGRLAGRAVLRGIRTWDRRAAERVTAYVANSRITRERIGDFYGRDATVIHPPVDVDRFTREPDPAGWFLVVGELTAHKNVDITLAAAEMAGVTVKVAGDGPDAERLRGRYRTAEFVGRVSDDELAGLYAGCRALVVSAIEEFGITMVEAQAAGRPVLAAAGGGALEIIHDGVDGVLFEPGDTASLAEAMRCVDWDAFDPAEMRGNAGQFSRERFMRRFAAEVSRVAQGSPRRDPLPALLAS